ncbi:MAG: hypothetical protein JRJ00_16330 [Deltaproteobacteria bacterium]|nr:hypothetical protein [Deltaproteobacteria bacterium]
MVLIMSLSKKAVGYKTNWYDGWIFANFVDVMTETALTGGVAKNRGVIEALEDKLKITMSIPENPQVTGALGAALLASDGIRS